MLIRMTCPVCRCLFTPLKRVTAQQVYCSGKCKMKAYWRRRLARDSKGDK